MHMYFIIQNLEKNQQCINQVPHEMEDQIPGDEQLQEPRKENAFSKT